MEKAIQCLIVKYADFSGRASRAEYWMFMLFSFIAAFLLIYVDYFTGHFGRKEGNEQFLLFSLVVAFIPAVSVTVRRLHDLQQAGWVIFLFLIPIFFLGSTLPYNILFTKGTEGLNIFGEDPLRTE